MRNLLTANCVLNLNRRTIVSTRIRTRHQMTQSHSCFLFRERIENLKLLGHDDHTSFIKGYKMIRHFESVTTPSLTNSNDQLYGDTDYLLSNDHNPLGNFTEETMELAIDLMEAWVRKNSFEGAQRATDLLFRIIDENLEGNPQAYFNNTMAETILLYWREVSENVCAKKASEIMARIRSIREEKDLPYNEMIAVLCKCRNRSAAVAVEHLLYKMIMIQKESNTNATKVDVITFNSAISAWLRISHIEHDAGQRALVILNRMKGMWRIGDCPVKPNINSFSMTIKALIRSEGPSAALQAEALLQDFLYFQDGNWQNEQQDIKNLFDTVLDALEKCSVENEDASNTSLNLLRVMERTQKVVPDSKSYLHVLRALSKRGMSSITHMEQIVNEIEQNSERNMNAILNTEIYNTLVKVYAEYGRGREAEATLQKMKKTFLHGNKEIKPNSVTWNSVIKAYIKSADKGAAYNASRILQEMATFAQENPETQPDTVTISIMLQALSRKCKNGDIRAKDQAVLILNRMLSSYEHGMECMKPDKIIFSKVIDCVAKAGAPNSGDEGMELLARMERFSKTCGTELIDSVIYNTVIQALANSQSKNAALEADKLFQKMKAKCDKNCAPTVATYTSLINAWGKGGSKLSTKRILELLHEVETHTNITPNTVLYASALNALAKSSEYSVLGEISAILHKMENGQFKGTPNAYCYAALVESISNHPDKKIIRAKLTQALRNMIDYASKNRNDESYTIVLNNALKAIEKSNEDAKYKLAQQVMDVVLEAHKNRLINAELTVRTFNAFIRCCAFTRGDQRVKKEAFGAALSALKEMREKNINPDMYTYPAVIRAAEELQGQNTECLEKVKHVFRMCCEDGLVDGLLLNNISNYLSEDTLRDVLQVNEVSAPIRLNDLPLEWSRNIYDKSARKSRTNKWYRGSSSKPNSVRK